LNEMLGRIEAAFLRVTQFTADASHELRTPVALIRTEAELALRKSRSEEEYREALAHILRQAEGTSVLIEELLSLARKDSGRETLELRPVHLSEILRDAARDWRPVAASRNLQFVETVEPGEATVLADAPALRRAIHIMLDNAFKYTVVPGIIEVFLESNNGTESIGIRDSGIGISTEDQAKIFERFYRADKARSREMGGAGLGLAIARWIVEQHHGTIQVQSTPGQGSVFRIELPKQDTPQPTPAA
jgi:signal transduction histidine kinase